MLKHILTGQPSSTAGSRLHHHNDYLHAAPGPSGAATSQRDHFHSQQQQQQPPAARAARAQSSADVYDGPTPNARGPHFLGQRHPLNHSQLSVNNLAQRLNASHHSHGLNLSTLSTSKHSVNSASPVVGATLPGRGHQHLSLGQTQALLAQLQQHQLQQQQQQQQQQLHQQQHHHQQQSSTSHLAAPERAKANGGLDISRASRLPGQATPSPGPQAPATASGGPSVVPLNASWSSCSLSRERKGAEAGVREMLTSLGLLCLVSLLLALLSLTFLVRMSSVSFVPNSLISPEEFAIVYDVTLVLCALALSLNLCCLLVCAIQFLFAVKLVKSSYHGHRTNKYLQKSSISRVCAVGGFFISIPVFLTGMILYTFIQFQSTPAIVTSVFIGLGIVFCGCALVHTVFVWQKEKTNAMKALRREQYEAAAQLQRQQTLHGQQHQPHSHHQQHQHQHSQQSQQQQQQLQLQQPRSLPISYGAASRLASNEPLAAGSLGPLSLSSQSARGGIGSAAGAPQQPLHQLHNHRHASMSPPLLLSSSLAGNGLHGQLNASQRGQLGQVLGAASPPATPGDRSPTSPANKHNRSQQLVSREATGSVSPGLPAATLDLSSAANTNSPHELSTLV